MSESSGSRDSSLGTSGAEDRTSHETRPCQLQLVGPNVANKVKVLFFPSASPPARLENGRRHEHYHLYQAREEKCNRDAQAFFKFSGCKFGPLVLLVLVVETNNTASSLVAIVDAGLSVF